MKRILRWLVEIALILSIILGVRAWYQQSLIEGEAPMFSVQSLNHGEVTLANYLGKPVLLYFWMKDCPMCELGQTTITSVQEDWPVITVAANTEEEQIIRDYLKQQDIASWVVILDKNNQLFNQYAVQATPTYYIIDAKGNIRFHEVGISSAWGIKARLWFAQD